MANGDDVKQIQFKVMDLDWSEVQGAPIIPCNVFVAQGLHTGHLLNCGFTDPPIKMRDAQAASDVKVRPGVRISMTREDAQMLLAVLQENLNATTEKQ